MRQIAADVLDRLTHPLVHREIALISADLIPPLFPRIDRLFDMAEGRGEPLR